MVVPQKSSIYTWIFHCKPSILGYLHWWNPIKSHKIQKKTYGGLDYPFGVPPLKKKKIQITVWPRVQELLTIAVMEGRSSARPVDIGGFMDFEAVEI